MATALGLAQRNLGSTWPNPAVGCVIVAPDGATVGRGFTALGGRPHAETEALLQAGDKAKGATAYVTLEPCAHQGLTGPCAEALVQAGIPRAVIACEDPDIRVGGQGIAILRRAGVSVTLGVMEAEALKLNEGFMSRLNRGRPFIALKLAMTMDGRIATKSGESQWITGPKAREFGHLLRRRYDAIMVGRATVRADNPELTCRLDGLFRYSPVRVVCDSGLTIPITSKLITTANQVPTWVITAKDPNDRVVQSFMETGGVDLISVDRGLDGGVDLLKAVESLAARGITRLLVEGGGSLAAGFIKAGLIDRVYVFRAGSVIGGDGISAINAFGLERLSEMTTFARQEVRPLGPDHLEIWDKSRS